MALAVLIFSEGFDLALKKRRNQCPPMKNDQIIAIKGNARGFLKWLDADYRVSHSKVGKVN